MNTSIRAILTCFIVLNTSGCQKPDDSALLAEYELKSYAEIRQEASQLEIAVTHNLGHALAVDAYDVGLRRQFPNLLSFVPAGEQSARLGDIQYLGLQDQQNVRGESTLRWMPGEELIVRIHLDQWYRAKTEGCYNLKIELPATSPKDDVFFTTENQNVLARKDGSPLIVCWRGEGWVSE